MRLSAFNLPCTEPLSKTLIRWWSKIMLTNKTEISLIKIASSMLLSLTQLFWGCHFIHIPVSIRHGVYVAQISGKGCKKEKESIFQCFFIYQEKTKTKAKSRKAQAYSAPSVSSILEVTLKRSKLQTTAHIHHFYRDKRVLYCSMTETKASSAMACKSPSINSRDPKFLVVTLLKLEQKQSLINIQQPAS